MTLIVGVDPSAKKVAMVAIDPVTLTYQVDTQTLYRKGQTSQDALSLHKAMDAVSDFLQRLNNTHGVSERVLYVENPVVGRGGPTTTIKQAYVGGIIRACAVHRGFTVYDVNVSEWRGGFLGVKTGKGRTTKIVKMETEAAIRVRDPKLHGLVSHDGDLIDAAGIALYGREQVRKAAGLVHAGHAGGALQGEGPEVVVRPARVRDGVRRTARMHSREVRGR